MITREEMDAFALQSHRRAAENTDNGFFPGEIVPVPIKDAETGELTGETLTTDEGIRRDASLESARGVCSRRGSPPTSPRPTSPRATRRR